MIDPSGFEKMRPVFERLTATMETVNHEFAKIGTVFSNIHDEIMVSAFGIPPRSAVDRLADLVREDDDDD